MLFAIAITLLIIDLKVPHITRESTFESVVADLSKLRYSFAALLFSFFLISMYWIRHHFLFKHIHNYNRTIVVANLAILLPIIFFPFTTSYLYESVSGNPEAVVIPYRLFMLNNALAGLVMGWFYWLVMK